MDWRCAVIGLALCGAAQAAEKKVHGPVISATGPDAEAYGRADGYPVGTRYTFTRRENLVGAFSHFDQLFPSRVAAKSGKPWEFKRLPQAVAIRYEFEGKTYALQDYLDRSPVTGLLILEDDTILAEHYQYGRTDHDRMLSQSMGKSITALLVGIAVGDGLIASVDDPAEKYAPELKGLEYGRTRIRDLLHMASGVKFSENYGGHDDDEDFETALLYGDPKRANTPAEALARHDVREAPPGTRWNYGAPEPYVLGLVLRGATGKPVTEYLYEKLWEPIGAEAPASWILDVSGQEMTHGFFSATLRDWGRLGRLLAHDGRWGAQQVVPRQWLIDATTVGADFLAPGKLVPAAPDFDLGYGYLTWLVLPGPERRMFALMGTRGQIVLVDPQTRLVMVQTAVRKNFVEPWYETFALWRGVLAAHGGK